MASDLASCLSLDAGQKARSDPKSPCRASSLPFRRIRWDVDTCHVMRDIGAMIKTFADRRTQELYATGKSKRIPADVARRAVRKLDYLSLAEQLDDLRVPPGNRLHALEGDRKGQYAISVNDQWRLCFRFEDGHAFDVEITDYH